MNNIFLLVFLISQLSLVIFCALREIKRQMNGGEIALFSSQWSFSPRFSAVLADSLAFSRSFGFVMTDWGSRQMCVVAVGRKTNRGCVKC